MRTSRAKTRKIGRAIHRSYLVCCPLKQRNEAAKLLSAEGGVHNFTVVLVHLSFKQQWLSLSVWGLWLYCLCEN